MKIYFACSIKGEAGDKEERQMMIQTLKKFGNEVSSEIFLEDNPNIRDGRQLKPEEIYQRDIDWIKECDIVVADVSKLSLGVGYEIGWAVNLGKKVLALCSQERYQTLSTMIKANTEPSLKVIVWNNSQDLHDLLKVEFENEN